MANHPERFSQTGSQSHTLPTKPKYVVQSKSSYGADLNDASLDDLIYSLNHFASMDSNSSSGQSPSSVDEYENDFIEDIATPKEATNCLEIYSHTSDEPSVLDESNLASEGICKSTDLEHINSQVIADIVVHPQPSPITTNSDSSPEPTDNNIPSKDTEKEPDNDKMTSSNESEERGPDILKEDDIGVKTSRPNSSSLTNDEETDNNTCVDSATMENEQDSEGKETNKLIGDDDAKENNILFMNCDAKENKTLLMNDDAKETNKLLRDYDAKENEKLPGGDGAKENTENVECESNSCPSNEYLEHEDNADSSSQSTSQQNIEKSDKPKDETVLSPTEDYDITSMPDYSGDVDDTNSDKNEAECHSLSTISEDSNIDGDDANSMEQIKENMNDRMKRFRDGLQCLKSKAVTGYNEKKHQDTPVVPDINLTGLNGASASDNYPNAGFPFQNTSDATHKSQTNDSTVAEDENESKEALSNILQEINCLSSGDDSVFERTSNCLDSNLNDSESQSSPILTLQKDISDEPTGSGESVELLADSMISSCSSNDKATNKNVCADSKTIENENDYEAKENTKLLGDDDAEENPKSLEENDKESTASSSDETKNITSNVELSENASNKDSKERPKSETGGTLSRLFQNLPFVRENDCKNENDYEAKENIKLLGDDNAEENPKSLEENDKESTASSSNETKTKTSNVETSEHASKKDSKQRPKSETGGTLSRLLQNLPFVRENDCKGKSSRPTSEHLSPPMLGEQIRFYSMIDDHERERGLSMAPDARDFTELLLFGRRLQLSNDPETGSQANEALDDDTVSNSDDLIQLLLDLSEQIKNAKSSTNFYYSDDGGKTIQEIKIELLENLHLLRNRINITVRPDIDSIDEENDNFTSVAVSDGAMLLARQRDGIDPEHPGRFRNRSKEDDNLSLEFFVPGSKKTFRLHRKTFIAFVLKYSIFMFSFLFWFSSLSVVSFGGWMLAKETAIVIDDFTDVFLDPYALLCMVGGIIFVVAFFGCVGALRENICLLRIFYLAMTFVLVLELLVGAIVFLFFTLPEFRQAVKVGPEEVLKRAVVNYFDDEGMQKWIDNLQKQFRCCGTSLTDDGYLDWQENIYFNCSSPSVYRCSVPLSCCIFEKRDYINYMCGADIIRREESYVRRYINTKGCMKSLGEWLADNTTIIAYITAGIVIPQIMSVVCARYFNSMLDNLTRDDSSDAQSEHQNTSDHGNSLERQGGGGGGGGGGGSRDGRDPQDRHPPAAGPSQAKRTWRRLSDASRALFHSTPIPNTTSRPV